MEDNMEEYFYNDSLSDSVTLDPSLTPIGKNNSLSNYTLSIDTIAVVLFIPGSLILNIGTIILIVRLRRRVSYFVVSLSIASILALLDQIPGALDLYGLIHLRGELLCGLMGCIRNFPSVVTPLSVAGDAWCRIRKPVPERGRSAAFRVLGLTWLVSLATLFPTYFMYSYDGNNSEQRPICRKARLLDSYWVTVAYYWHRCFIYHVLTTAYLCYAFYRTKLKVKAPLFGSDIPSSMKKGIARLRLILLYDIMFCIIWLPSGFFFPIQYMISDGDGKQNFRPFITHRTMGDFPFADLLPFIFFVFLALHPPIFYLTHVGISAKDFSSCVQPNRQTSRSDV